MPLNVVIFGQDNCPFCVKAKELAARLGADLTYIDIHERGLTKDDLSVICNQPVTTVPQVFVNEEHLGGYTEFAERFPA